MDREKPARLIVLARICLGGPGWFLWIAGSLVSVPMGVWILAGNPPPLKQAVIFGMALVSVIVGFLMMSVPAILTGSARFRFEGKHVPHCLALEITLQLLLFLAACSLPCVIYLPPQGKSGMAIGLLALFLSSVWGITRVFAHLADCRGKWEHEFTGAENPQIP